MAQREGDGVALVFRGEARMFIGVVTVEGAKGGTVNTQLQRASRLNSGTRFTQRKMTQALEQMKLALAENGYNEASITHDRSRNTSKSNLSTLPFTWSPGRRRGWAQWRSAATRA